MNYQNNPSARHIINETIKRSNKPLNKYNESMHMETEELSGEPNDRTAYETGNDPITKNK